MNAISYCNYYENILTSLQSVNTVYQKYTSKTKGCEKSQPFFDVARFRNVIITG